MIPGNKVRDRLQAAREDLVAATWKIDSALRLSHPADQLFMPTLNEAIGLASIAMGKLYMLLGATEEG